MWISAVLKVNHNKYEFYCICAFREYDVIEMSIMSLEVLAYQNTTSKTNIHPFHNGNTLMSY